MRILYGLEKDEAKRHFNLAADLARGSKCLRARGGALIVNGNMGVAGGHNSPPGDVGIDRCFKDDLPDGFKSDRTCCVHAEKRAIHNALSTHPGKLEDARIYFTRIDENNQIVKAGRPYCTGCSKDILDVGIAEVVLWHENGICVYDSVEYNELSFKHGEWVDET